MLKLFSALVLITSLVKSDYSDDDHTVQLNNLGAKQLGQKYRVIYQKGFSVDFSLDTAKKEITLVARVPDNTYLSVGWGETMYETDMIVWQATKKGESSDLLSLDHSTPKIDESQDYKTTMKKYKGGKKFTSVRSLDTGDTEQDRVIDLSSEPQIFCWALNEGGSDFGYHSARGNF